MQIIPMPMKHQPKPAAKPAAAPKVAVVAGALRYIARLIDITRLSRKLMAKIFGVLAGGGVLVGAIPLGAVLPAGLGEADEGAVAAGLEVEDDMGTGGADSWEFV